MRKLALIAVGLLFAAMPFLAISQPAVPVVYTPDTSMQYAMGDMASLPESVRPYIRYLSLYNVPDDKKPMVAQTVSFVVNSLSRRRKIYVPFFVGASNRTVIRINLRDYDIDPKVWDDLGRKGSGAKPFPEPYFHAVVEKVNTGVSERKVRRERQVATGYYVHTPQGLQPQYRTEVYYDVVREAGEASRERVYQQAPWLNPTTVGLLTEAAQTEYPMFRADWFIVNSMIDPVYKDFLRLGDQEKTFDEAIFADVALAEKARVQTKAVVVKSAVARNNRTLLRSPTVAGYKWESHDTLKSTDDRNYVQNFLREKFDAKEIIATLPNGLQVYFVTDGKGNRTDTADNEVATDYMSTDKVVRNARSCVYCHSSGILSIQDEIRTLNRRLTNREQIQLLVTKEEDAYRIEDLFGTNLDHQIVKDQQLYADAVGLATGLSPQKNATQFMEIWEGYIESLLTKEQIAADCGLTVPELEKYARLSNDPLFLGLVQNPIRPVRRDHFEQAYQTFMLITMQARGKAVAPVPVIKGH